MATINGRILLADPLALPSPVEDGRQGCPRWDVHAAIGPGGVVAGAAVALSRLDDEARCPPTRAQQGAPQRRPALTLRAGACAISPRQSVAEVGQTLSLSSERSGEVVLVRDRVVLLSQSVPAGGSAAFTFVQAGLYQLGLTCGPDWQEAWVLVGTSPFLTVTGPDGAFAFGPLPPGRWALAVHHGGLGQVSRVVETQPGEDVHLTVRF